MISTYFTISNRLPEEVQAKGLATDLPDYNMVQNQKEESQQTYMVVSLHTSEMEIGETLQ